MIETGNNNNEGDNDMKTARALAILVILAGLIAVLVQVKTCQIHIPGAPYPQTQSH